MGNTSVGTSYCGGRSQEEIFDEFICDMFSNKLNLTSSIHKSMLRTDASFFNQPSLPLDQTLLISTAKKQNMTLLMNNMSLTSSEGNGLLSVDEIRHAARILGDLSSARLGQSSSGQLNFLNEPGIHDSLMGPLKLDFN